MTRSGPTPFGYTRKGDRLVRNEHEAAIRLKIFELFLVHQRKKSVADILNENGFRTKTGSDFSGQSVGRFLSDDIVLGEDPKVDQIVPSPLYEKCQNILSAQSKKGGATRTPNHPFAGIAHCGCGGKMYVPTGSRKYVCRECRAKIAIRDLETIFVETMITRLEKEKADTVEANDNPYDGGSGRQLSWPRRLNPQ